MIATLKRILIVEDNFIASEELQIRLQKLGYDSIKTAFTGEEAVKIAQDYQPGLILMDINLGKGITGIEAAECIREEQNIPIIYITAYDDDNTLQKAQATEPYSYILKPFGERELSIAISIAFYKHETELKLRKNNEELRQANETKDKLFSILSHDLRTPFQGILGFSEHIHRQLAAGKTDGLVSRSARLAEAAKSGHALLMNILHWSRSQRGMLQASFAPAAVSEIFNEALDAVRYSAARKKIAMVVEGKTGLTVETDRDMLSAVLRNILSNAVKFSPQEKEVRLRVESDEDEFTISVIDSGGGIPEATLQQLNDGGTPLSLPGTNGEEGTGLGWIICRELIEQLGGSYRIESSPGQGTRVELTFPISHE